MGIKYRKAALSQGKRAMLKLFKPVLLDLQFANNIYYKRVAKLRKLGFRARNILAQNRI